MVKNIRGEKLMAEILIFQNILMRLDADIFYLHLVVSEIQESLLNPECHSLTQSMLSKEELELAIQELNSDLAVQYKKVAISIDDAYKPG